MTWEGYYTRSCLLRGTETAVHMFFKISVTPKQMFSGEFCKTYKNTFFTDHLRAAASDLMMKLLYFAVRKLRLLSINMLKYKAFRDRMTLSCICKV